MDERDRLYLRQLLRDLLLENRYEREKVEEDCEGRFDSLASYVERRLRRELPPE